MGTLEELSMPIPPGCSTLGAKHKQIDEEWNDLSRIVLPSRI
jgi:hypothetical protein